jgi:hypothetical protein
MKIKQTILALSTVALGLSLVCINASADEQDQADPVARTKELMRASPQQILQMRKSIAENLAARQAPIQGDFEPQISQETMDIEELFPITLQPDSLAPKVFLARYQSTAISFIDAYGNPWPIRKISNFLKDQVLIDKAMPDEDVQKDGAKESAGTDNTMQDPQSGSFTMTALKQGVTGNITVYLAKLPTPISINLVGKPSMYHRLATMRVEQAGPQTDSTQFQKNDGVVIGSKADPDLNNALYGVSPLGSETMVVQGAEGKAWLKGDYLYLQTSISVFSPEIIGTSHGEGKFSAYKLPKTTQVMGTNSEGKTVSVKIMRHPATAIIDETSLSGASR